VTIDITLSSINKAFMSSHCPQSCEVCTGGKVRDWDQHENKDPDCNDTHSQCEFWASEGECVANPGYMMRSCRLSCNVCINIKSLREKGIDELEM
jgi:ShK domain-like